MENSINNRKKFVSSIDNDEEREMNSKRENIEIMISDKADVVTK